MHPNKTHIIAAIRPGKCIRDSDFLSFMYWVFLSATMIEFMYWVFLSATMIEFKVNKETQELIQSDPSTSSP